MSTDSWQYCTYTHIETYVVRFKTLYQEQMYIKYTYVRVCLMYKYRI